MKYIDTKGRGNTLCIFTDAESRLLRSLLVNSSPTAGDVVEAREAFNRGIQRGTERMAEESKAERNARKP